MRLTACALNALCFTFSYAPQGMAAKDSKKGSQWTQEFAVEPGHSEVQQDSGQKNCSYKPCPIGVLLTHGKLVCRPVNKRQYHKIH
jgi:hypothetical protein